MSEPNAHLEWIDHSICDAISALRSGRYDGLTAEEHLEYLLRRIRGVK